MILREVKRRPPLTSRPGPDATGTRAQPRRRAGVNLTQKKLQRVKQAIFWLFTAQMPIIS